MSGSEAHIRACSSTLCPVAQEGQSVGQAATAPRHHGHLVANRRYPQAAEDGNRPRRQQLPINRRRLAGIRPRRSRTLLKLKQKPPLRYRPQCDTEKSPRLRPTSPREKSWVLRPPLQSGPGRSATAATVHTTRAPGVASWNYCYLPRNAASNSSGGPM